MTDSPISYERTGPLAVLWWDTPNSPVNVLTEEAAAALVAHLQRALSEGARAIVLRSRKRGSFCNGARLLAAASMRTEADARARTGAMRQFYDALEASPLPTVAVIEGSCFGCGMELTLRCDYRVTSESATAHFYLTEVPDYLLTPVFGSTQRLTSLVGLKMGAELLLWGRHLRGRAAKRAGLADAVMRVGKEERDLSHFVARLSERGFPKAARTPQPLEPGALATGLAAEEKRIAALPPPVRGLHRRGLEVLSLPLRPGYSRAAGMEEEMRAFCETTLQPPASQAIAFFFTRQTARMVGAGSVAAPLPPRLTVVMPKDVPTLARRLARHPIAGLSVRERSTDAGSLRFHKRTEKSRPGTIVVCGPGEAPPRAHDGASLYLPFSALPEPACEIALPVGVALPAGLVELLETLDLQPVFTRPGERWVSDRLLEAYRRPIAAWIEQGGDLGAAETALADFGFKVSLAGISRRAHLLANDAMEGSEVLVGRVLDSLRDEALAILAERGVAHPSQLEVAAFAVLGFPLHRGSLIRHLQATGRWPEKRAASPRATA